MKHLIRRLSRVADSTSSFRNRRGHHRLHAPARRVNNVPAGHVPVYVGDEMERFVVSAELLNHPIFVRLLNRSAQEYGYAQKGVLRIPCHVIFFEHVVETLRLGLQESGEFQDLGDELITETTDQIGVKIYIISG